MFATVRVEGEESAVDLAQLDEDLRWGRTPPEAELRHGPWTGEGFVRIDRIPQLAEALDSPNARFAAHLRAWRWPWAAISITLLVMTAAIAQQAAQWGLSPLPVEGIEVKLVRLGLGFVPSLLEARWWTPWTSQLVHSPSFAIAHMLCNIGVIGYCGYRVERALGAAGLALVGAGAILVATPVLALLSNAPVVGSSILAFAFGSAQIAIGFRMGEAVPPGWRGYYGVGTAKLFAILYAQNLLVQGVSHLGHLSGIMGGALVVFLLPPATAAPRHRARVARRQTWALALGVGVAPMLLCLGISRLPTLLAWPAAPVELPGASATLELPKRMEDHPVSGLGLSGWRPGFDAEDIVFGGLYTLHDPNGLADEALGEWWSQLLDGAPRTEEAPLPILPGWTSAALRFDDPDTGERRWGVVEHQLRRGRLVLRVGYVLSLADPRGEEGRVGLYRQILSSIIVAQPAALVEARDKWARNPASPSRIWEYVLELERAGQVEEADSLCAGLLSRSDGWEWDAARARLGFRKGAPVLFSGEDRAWLTPFLGAASPSDRGILEPGIWWLVHERDCEGAGAALGRVSPEGEELPDWAALLFESVTWCGEEGEAEGAPEAFTVSFDIDDLSTRGGLQP